WMEGAKSALNLRQLQTAVAVTNVISSDTQEPARPGVPFAPSSIFFSRRLNPLKSITLRHDLAEVYLAECDRAHKASKAVAYAKAQVVGETPRGHPDGLTSERDLVGAVYRGNLQEAIDAARDLWTLGDD